MLILTCLRVYADECVCVRVVRVCESACVCVCWLLGGRWLARESARGKSESAHTCKKTKKEVLAQVSAGHEDIKRKEKGVKDRYTEKYDTWSQKYDNLSAFVVRKVTIRAQRNITMIRHPPRHPHTSDRDTSPTHLWRHPHTSDVTHTPLTSPTHLLSWYFLRWWLHARVCDKIHSYVLLGFFVWVTSLSHMYLCVWVTSLSCVRCTCRVCAGDVAHSYIRCDAFYVTWLFHVRDVTDSYLWRGLCMCVTLWISHVTHMKESCHTHERVMSYRMRHILYMNDVAYACMWRDWFMRVTRLIYSFLPQDNEWMHLSRT